MIAVTRHRKGGAESAVRLVVFEGLVVEDELMELGRWMAEAVRPGDLVLLEGPLGAGKTILVRALAAALGVTDVVRSPSFTIANVYAGPILVNHLDLYRLQDVADEDVLALDEYRSPDAVTLVEWPEAGRGRLGSPQWVVHLGHDTPTTRRVRVVACGADVAGRLREAGPSPR